MKLDINQIFKQAVSQQQEGKLDEAERLYREILEVQPKHQDSNNNLGVLLQNLNKFDEAIMCYKKAIEIKPDYAEAINNLGVTLFKLNRLDEAEVNFRKATDIKTDYVEAFNNLGGLLVKLNRFDDAILYYKKAAEIKPTYAKKYFNLGAKLFNLNKFDEAITYAKKAIELKPGYAEAFNILGVILYRLNKFDEATAYYKKAIELKPDYAEAFNNLGVIFFNLNKFDEATAYYKKAIELKPDYAEAFNNLGALLYRLNKPDEAIAHYKKAVEIKPDYVEAKHILTALSEGTSKSAPREYVESLFDKYASHFENSLVNKLEYNIPKKIIKMITTNNSNIQLGSILDLGCGTGLIGDEIKNFCSNLQGIDLSLSMLDQAKNKNIYDKLEQRDITEYLSTENLDFNYFIAADVFVYVGDLSEVFRLIKSRKKSKGKLVFSTEHTDKDGFFLEKSGRYSHSKKYIENLCQKFDYKLSYFEETDLRKDKNKFLTGGLYLLDF